ncbi:hypothetical protein ACFPRL_15115 [Pseudoclavibacter helvolus]
MASAGIAQATAGASSSTRALAASGSWSRGGSTMSSSPGVRRCSSTESRASSVSFAVLRARLLLRRRQRSGGRCLPWSSRAQLGARTRVSLARPRRRAAGTTRRSRAFTTTRAARCSWMLAS